MPTDYTMLIAAQHRKPRFVALIEAITEPLLEVQALLEEMRSTFDLDTAIGVQLDATGEWIGRTRILRMPLADVYFSWDVEGLGWGQGMWMGKYDPVSGVVSLPDDIYRRLLKAKVAANAWDGTVDNAYDVWVAAFADTGSIILIQDNMDMSMGVGIAGMPLDAVTKQLLLQQYIPLKPEGVRVRWYAVTPDGGPLFAWNCESEALAGWDDGTGKGGRWPEVLLPNSLGSTSGENTVKTSASVQL